MRAKKSGILIVVSGPSGVGKGTVCNKILNRNRGIVKSISATTRAPRPGEVDGDNYFFVTSEKFSEMIKSDEFLENFEIYGNRYGTPKSFVEKNLQGGFDVLLEIDVQGGLAVKDKYPDAVLVFMIPHTFEQLEKRWRGRKTESDEVIAKRLAAAASELEKIKEYHYVVMNYDADKAAENILKIIDSEKMRTKHVIVQDLIQF